MFYNKFRIGEVATTLTIIAVLLMGAGAIIGSKLTQSPQTIGSKAAADTCYLSNTPQLVKEGANVYCDVAISNPPNPPPTRVNCTLINPSRSSDSQILTDSVFFRWYGAGESPSNTLRFQLSQRGDYTSRLSPGNTYRLVAYRLAENWSTSLCDKTKDDVTANDLSQLFGTTSANPTTPPTAPTTPNTAGSCETLEGNKIGGSPTGVRTGTNKRDTTNVCNPACCEFNDQCPSGQQCNIPNGFCKSGFSCNSATAGTTTPPTNTPVPATATPIPTNTPIPTPQCLALGYSCGRQLDCASMSPPRTATGGYGCNMINASYLCCFPQGVTLPPTQTPVPTATNTPVPSRTPVPPTNTLTTSTTKTPAALPTGAAGSVTNAPIPTQASLVSYPKLECKDFHNFGTANFLGNTFVYFYYTLDGKEYLFGSQLTFNAAGNKQFTYFDLTCPLPPNL